MYSVLDESVCSRERRGTQRNRCDDTKTSVMRGINNDRFFFFFKKNPEYTKISFLI